MLCKSFPLSSCIPIEAVNFKRENILCQCDFDMKLFQQDCIHCELNKKAFLLYILTCVWVLHSPTACQILLF